MALQDGCSARTMAELLKHLDSLFSNDVARITLSTIHKAKGLEWPQVALLGPSLLRLGRGQEDNLAYVAVTRAQSDLLYLREDWTLVD